MTAVQASASSSLERSLAVIGLLTVGGFITFIVTIVLGSIGVSFLASGIGVFVAGVMGLTDNLQMDGPPVLAVVIGPPLAAAGMLALAGLFGYFWVAIKVVRRVVG
jgi:hypothetical protein